MAMAGRERGEERGQRSKSDGGEEGGEEEQLGRSGTRVYLFFLFFKIIFN